MDCDEAWPAQSADRFSRRPADPAGRNGQSQDSGQSGASVSGDQAAVWRPENTLPRLEEEHRTTDDAVWAGQHLAGA